MDHPALAGGSRLNCLLPFQVLFRVAALELVAASFALVTLQLFLDLQGRAVQSSMRDVENDLALRLELQERHAVERVFGQVLQLGAESHRRQLIRDSLAYVLLYRIVLLSCALRRRQRDLVSTVPFLPRCGSAG